MAEPTLTKVTAVTILASFAGGVWAPFLVEWGGVIVGAGAGAYVCVSFAKERGGVSSFGAWLLAMVVGVIATPAAEWALEIAHFPLPPESRLNLLPFLALVVAAFWRQILTGLPALFDRFRPPKQGGGPP
jgi:hypothetical protein